MSRDLSDLQPSFRDRVVDVLADCLDAGYEMRPFFTVRHPLDQAKLWRQSRNTQQIQDAVRMLRNNRADFLADCLEQAGPQHGRWATNALPGQSWHQWGLAVDCFLNIDGKAIWNGEHEGYRVYAEIAKKHKLYSLIHIGDAVHIQMPKAGNPLNLYTWAEADKVLKAKYGGQQWT